MFLINYYTNNKNKSLLIVHALFFFITACCFGYCDYFLLSDYPNHLAKVHLYNHLSDTHKILSEYYYRNDAITPYMAFNTIVGFFEPITGIYLAGKIFIIFALFIILSGGLFLNYTLYHRITPFSLFIHIFMFNMNLYMGFMNFVLGLGLILWGYGLWIKHYKPTLKFYGVFATYAILVLFTHVFALFILGVVIGLYQLSNSPKGNIPDFLKSCFYAGLKVLTFTIIPMVLVVFLFAKDNNFPLHTNYHESLIVNFSLSFVTPLLFELKYIPALLMISVFIGLICFKKIELRQPFVLILFFILGLCVPFYVAGVACANERIPAFVGLLFAVSARFKGKNEHIVFCSVILGIISCALYFNNINLLQDYSHSVSEFVKTIKDNKKLFAQRLLTVNNKHSQQLHYTNFSNYAVIEGRMFNPALFTHIPHISMYKKYEKIYGCQQQPITAKKLRMSDIQLQKYLKKFDEPTQKSVCPNNFYWKNWRHDFDYVLWIHFDKQPTDIPHELSVYKQGSFFTLYKIKKTIK